MTEARRPGYPGRSPRSRDRHRRGCRGPAVQPVESSSAEIDGLTDGRDALDLEELRAGDPRGHPRDDELQQRLVEATKSVRPGRSSSWYSARGRPRAGWCCGPSSSPSQSASTSKLRDALLQLEWGFLPTGSSFDLGSSRPRSSPARSTWSYSALNRAIDQPRTRPISSGALPRRSFLGGRFVLGDVVVPDRPDDAVIPLEEGFDRPDKSRRSSIRLCAAASTRRLVWTAQGSRGDTRRSAALVLIVVP